ncbi:hypothetical protein FALBO_3995 [Fusarium albosuccineum]|uniref:Uncharacterized protein n=1 Tax=Fusarium albosuccineum TaxID=1237068 RepID=A0A8H4PB64_9HYPO|nr:hypothetical protein FALBO_3995 [Fusarium albosuccineum]
MFLPRGILGRLDRPGRKSRVSPVEERLDAFLPAEPGQGALGFLLAFPVANRVEGFREDVCYFGRAQDAATVGGAMADRSGDHP